MQFNGFVTGHDNVGCLICIACMLEGQCFGNYHGNSNERRNFLRFDIILPYSIGFICHYCLIFLETEHRHATLNTAEVVTFNHHFEIIKGLRTNKRQTNVVRTFKPENPCSYTSLNM